MTKICTLLHIIIIITSVFCIAYNKYGTLSAIFNTGNNKNSLMCSFDMHSMYDMASTVLEHLGLIGDNRFDMLPVVASSDFNGKCSQKNTVEFYGKS